MKAPDDRLTVDLFTRQGLSIVPPTRDEIASNVPAPYVRNSPTSKQAAADIEPKAGTLRRLILDYLQWVKPQGATDEELQRALKLDGSTERPRRIELERAGLVIDSGRRATTASGRHAVIWRAKDHD